MPETPGTPVRWVLTAVGLILLFHGNSLSAQSIYYGDHNRGEIRRIDRDGATGETLATSGKLCGVALDLERGKIYWTNNLEDQILRADLDCTSMSSPTTPARSG